MASLLPSPLRERWRRFADLAFVDRSPAATAAGTNALAIRRAPPVVPLTHQDVVGLSGPFARTGRRVDLAASDRLRRRLVFRASSPAEAREDSLVLESPRGGRHRVERRWSGDAGASAGVVAEARDVGSALRAADAADPASLIERGPGWVIGRHVHVQPEAGVARPVSATVAVGDATVQLRFPEVPGLPARFEIRSRQSQSMALDDDLLAVLGWDWSPLRAEAGGWAGSVRMRGRDLAREAERITRALAEHLAATLAASPRQFHERQWSRRIGVTLRRAVPLLALAALAAEAALAPQLYLLRSHPGTLALLLAPLALLTLWLRCSEDPRFELPRWPRPSAAGGWLRRD